MKNFFQFKNNSDNKSAFNFYGLDPEVLQSYALVTHTNFNYKVNGIYNLEDNISALSSPLSEIDVVIVHLGKSKKHLINEFLKKTDPDNKPKIIFLCENADLETLNWCFRQGAKNILLKNNDYKQYLECVVSLINQEPYLSKDFLSCFINSMIPVETDLLSEREKEVINQLAFGKTYDETANSLHISKDTVKTHLKNIYIKLNASSKVDALKKARKLGLIPGIQISVG